MSACCLTKIKQSVRRKMLISLWQDGIQIWRWNLFLCWNRSQTLALDKCTLSKETKSITDCMQFIAGTSLRASNDHNFADSENVILSSGFWEIIWHILLGRSKAKRKRKSFWNGSQGLLCSYTCAGGTSPRNSWICGHYHPKLLLQAASMHRAHPWCTQVGLLDVTSKLSWNELAL